jgi:hypothetical protein
MDNCKQTRGRKRGKGDCKRHLQVGEQASRDGFGIGYIICERLFISILVRKAH